jgi:hypothetical protein
MLGCDHCRGCSDEPGFIETDNNGPIVACPFCNREYDTPQKRREREFEAAQAQCEIISKRTTQIGPVTVNFTVGRIGKRRSR